MGPTYCALCPLLYRRHEALELHLRPMRHQFYWLPFLPFPSGYGHTKKLTLSTYHGHWNHPGHNGMSIYPSKSSVGSLVPGPETGGHRWNSWNRPPSFNVCMEWFHWLCVMVYIPYFPKLSPFIAFFLTAHFSQDDYPYDWLVFSLRCTHPHLWFFLPGWCIGYQKWGRFIDTSTFSPPEHDSATRLGSEQRIWHHHPCTVSQWHHPKHYGRLGWRRRRRGPRSWQEKAQSGIHS